MDFALRVLNSTKSIKSNQTSISLMLIAISFAIYLPYSVISLSGLSKNFHHKSKLSWCRTSYKFYNIKYLFVLIFCAIDFILIILLQNWLRSVYTEFSGKKGGRGKMVQELDLTRWIIHYQTHTKFMTQLAERLKWSEKTFTLLMYLFVLTWLPLNKFSKKLMTLKIKIAFNKYFSCRWFVYYATFCPLSLFRIYYFPLRKILFFWHATHN